MNAQKIAKETLTVTKENGYHFNGGWIQLCEVPESMREVIVCTPQFVSDSIRSVSEGKISPKEVNAEIIVNDFHSLESVRRYASEKTLVLNFANAYTPGGGFLIGASAQEEALCRCSTLYASLSSEKAKEMYSFNRQNWREGSTYMLLSPYVYVFRHSDGSFAEKVFCTSVISAAAPDLGGESCHLNDSELEILFKSKIRNVLSVAAVKEYETLVLGAWGCGAFGNDAKDVARYFHSVLFEEGYERYFKRIVFSVYVGFGSRYNFNAFNSVFGNLG